MLDFIQQKALTLALMAVPIGLIASLVYQGVKKASDTVDALPAWAHRGAVAVVALAVTAISSALGVTVVCDEGVNCLTKLDQDTVKMLLEAALALVPALLAHKVKIGRAHV